MGSANHGADPKSEAAEGTWRTPEEKARGRQAEWPSDIPRPGWKDILTRVFQRISRDNISIIAAGVAFYGFVAIPSALTALVALYGLVFNPQDVEHQVASMAGVLPKDVISLVSTQLTTVVSNNSSKLSVSVILGFLIALWSARSGTSSLITALNVAYRE
jgi:membrane protein